MRGAGAGPIALIGCGGGRGIGGTPDTPQPGLILDRFAADRRPAFPQTAAMEHRLVHTLRALGAASPAAGGDAKSSQQHILVVGATGLLGRAVVDHFGAIENWTVSSIARREIMGDHRSTHYQLDLMDGQSCRSVLRSSPELASVTQIVYTALYGSNVWDSEERRVNLAMLQNVLEPMLEIARDLRHVDLMQGREWLQLGTAITAYGSWNAS